MLVWKSQFITLKHTNIVMATRLPNIMWLLWYVNDYCIPVLMFAMSNDNDSNDKRPKTTLRKTSAKKTVYLCRWTLYANNSYCLRGVIANGHDNEMAYTFYHVYGYEYGMVIIVVSYGEKNMLVQIHFLEYNNVR